MFEIGWSELLVIAVVAIIVVGPRELPAMLRTFGRYMGQMRRMAADFQTQFNEALKEAELDTLKRDVESLARMDPIRDLEQDMRQEMEPIARVGDDLKKAVEAPVAPGTPGAPAEPAAIAARSASPAKPAGVKPKAARSAAKATAKVAAKPKTAAKPAAPSAARTKAAAKPAARPKGVAKAAKSGKPVPSKPAPGKPVPAR